MRSVIPFVLIAGCAPTSGSATDTTRDVPEIDSAEPAGCVDDAPCGPGRHCIGRCGGLDGVCRASCGAGAPCATDEVCRWVRSAENAYVTVCAEPDLSACPSGCQRPVAGPDDFCPCDGGCNLICIDGFLGPECGRTTARGECPAGFTSAVIPGGPDPIVACVYMFLDAGKPCSDASDCDATHDEELICRDFDDGRFCSRPCDGEFGPLVCRDGFYRLPNEVPLPAHVE